MEVVDEQGLREAFQTHGGELLGFARRSLYNSSNAEDAVQETFVRAWRSRNRFDSSLGSLRTWLFAIERRVILDISDRQRRAVVVPIDDTEISSGDDWIERSLAGWQVETALARLPVEHRSIVTELYFNGRTSREVGEMFGIPDGTVRSRAFYALRLLRVFLEEVGWNE